MSYLQRQQEEGEDDVQEEEEGVKDVPLYPIFASPTHQHRHHFQTLTWVPSACNFNVSSSSFLHARWFLQSSFCMQFLLFSPSFDFAQKFHNSLSSVSACKFDVSISSISTCKFQVSPRQVLNHSRDFCTQVSSFFKTPSEGKFQDCPCKRSSQLCL